MVMGACAVVVAVLGTASLARGQSPQPRRSSVNPLLISELAALTGEGVSRARARHDLTVQGEVAQADLAGSLQAAMGNAYAGVWFDDRTAQLEVGATSQRGRRMSEEVATSAGLAGDVTVTPVRSTVRQLLSAQDHWNRKLADLFAHEQVTTGLEPQRNAVAITLRPSVPAPERGAVKREASTAAVNVLVTVQGPRSSASPLASAARLAGPLKTECNKFEAMKARCNPSITSGVTIKHIVCVEEDDEGAQLFSTEQECEEAPEKATGKGGTWSQASFDFCTAGPLASNGTKTFLLTAGHCVVEGEKWQALNKAGTESVLGPAQANPVNGGDKGEGKGDYGDIQIEAAWQTGNAMDPVLGVTAEWTRNEGISYPVKGVRAPTVGTDTCYAGQSSGEPATPCGKVAMVNDTYMSKGTYKEGMIEVKGISAASGDSGGPFFSYVGGDNPNHEVFMEGILTAGQPNEVDFEPLLKPAGQTIKGALELLGLKLITKRTEGPGECVEFKDGGYSDASCNTEDFDKGKPKGKHEWESAGSCYEKKKGMYSESKCETLEVKHGKPDGKWELAGSK